MSWCTDQHHCNTKCTMKGYYVHRMYICAWGTIIQKYMKMWQHNGAILYNFYSAVQLTTLPTHLYWTTVFVHMNNDQHSNELFRGGAQNYGRVVQFYAVVSRVPTRSCLWTDLSTQIDNKCWNIANSYILLSKLLWHLLWIVPIRMLLASCLYTAFSC